MGALALVALFGAWVGCGSGNTVSSSDTTGSGGGGGTASHSSGHATATSSAHGTGGTGTGGTGGTGGGTMCNPGETDCNGTCAKADDPNFGCGAQNCMPCTAIANAMVTCSGGQCVLGGCNNGFKNCNGNDTDGCEVNTQTDPNQCGACGSPCVVPNATANCVAGVCGIGACTGTFVDCDGDVTNGCESDTTVDPLNCGTCGMPCPGGETCEMGICGVYCPKGKANCNNDPSDGCEVQLGTDTDCDFCGDACDLANSMSHCDNTGMTGVCTLDMCNTGFANCDMIAANGCETNTNTDAGNCNSCGNVCPSGPHSTAVCNNGGCAIVCDPGYSDCDNNPTTGCEVHSDVDVSNCGNCKNVCTTPNGTPGCVSGQCTIVTCASPFQDCDKQVPDGCETNTNTDANNCGMCMTVCSTPNATPACSAGMCTIGMCNNGYADCNSMPSDGCEIDLTSNVNNCGMCGNVCTVANGTPGCTNKACTVAGCNTGFQDCNSAYSDGCEINVTNNVNNCGSCNHVCVTPNATPSCSNNACGIAMCNLGFKDCNGTVADGCEINTNTDPNNCGACTTPTTSHVCNLPHAVAGCAAGSCTIASCNAGWSDCDGNPLNGCEVNTGADPLNCGACTTPTQNHVCSIPHATAACTGGVCTIGMCSAGFADCKNGASDGCETNIAGDPLNCGGCTTPTTPHVCTVANGTAGCTAGACTVTGCNFPFADCINGYADGCETNTNSDVNHCGSCAKNCNTSCSNAGGATFACSNASGTPTCVIPANGCGATHFDVDASCTNGCECTTKGTSNSCLNPTDLGTIAIGGSTSYIGNIVPAGTDAYLSVTFSGFATIGTFHPHITLSGGAAGEFLFDILTNCGGGTLTCNGPSEGGNSTGRTDWETSYTAAANASDTGYSTILAATSGKVIIHVYRANGKPLTCNNYTLSISD